MEANSAISQMQGISEQETGISFTALRLRPGTVLHIQRDAIGAPLSEIHFLGSIPDKFIMVTEKMEEDSKIHLKAGERYILNGFSGQYDFSFTAEAVELHLAPFPYATLAYPATVQARLVRKLTRIKTAFPAKITSLSSDAVADATLADLTAAGALIESQEPLAKPDENIHIAFTAELGNEKKDLALIANVRHLHPTTNGSYHTGVEFRDVSQADKLMLHYIVDEWAEKAG